MSSGSQMECPLCMDPLELDDINFFPCTCGYQVCRFCWHRIRTNENGLCPACRRFYTEDPAEFKPLAETDLRKIKKEKRQKESQKKQKAAENRKHLANVRVVQKNLVFVVGLTQRLADVEVLKKHEYFGKFGKIHKIVINQSTSYAGVQGPSASAYVTYYRSEDAIRAIQAVSNVTVDGRTIKASLGTTKYCSYFLRGLSCAKPECMYLHEPGDEQASFTKEQMQQGKHLEYEQLLYDAYNQSMRVAAGSSTAILSNTVPLPLHSEPTQNHISKSSSSAHSLKKSGTANQHQILRHSNSVQSTENRPSNASRVPVQSSNRSSMAETTEKLGSDINSSVNGNNACSSKQKTNLQNRLPLETKTASSLQSVNRCALMSQSSAQKIDINQLQTSSRESPTVTQTVNSQVVMSQSPPCDTQENKSSFLLDETSVGNSGLLLLAGEADDVCISDLLMKDPEQYSLFSASESRTDTQDDDLGFDPWNESTKGLADMMEKENKCSEGGIGIVDPNYQANHLNNCKVGHPPEGFYSRCPAVSPSNKALGLKQVPVGNPNCRMSPPYDPYRSRNTVSTTALDYQEWQNDLRHVLPKTNNARETLPQTASQMLIANHHPMQQYCQSYSNLEKEWCSRNSRPEDFLWLAPPAVQNNFAARNWMASLQQFSDGFPGFQQGLRPQLQNLQPFSLISNSRPPVHFGPGGIYSLSSLPSHLEGSNTLADGVD